MISNVKKNCMGTISFDGKFGSMRKAQDFIVYPMSKGELPVRARIQSDKKAGYVNLLNGRVMLGANQYDFAGAVMVDQLADEVLEDFKIAIVGSASEKAGSNGIAYCDNSGAVNVFGGG